MLPLFLLFFSVESFYVLNKIIDNYEINIQNDYSIVLVSKVPLDKKAILNTVKDADTLQMIKTDKVLDRLKSNISKRDLEKLKSTLPLFYSLKLKRLPDTKELISIKNKLLQIPGIKSVSTFKKSYSKFYNFLLFNKMLLLFFAVLVGAIVLLLIVKQSEVWIFEHKQRFEVMTILGAPFWMKTAMLYRVVIVDSILSSTLVSLIFYFLSHNEKTLNYFRDMGIELPKFCIYDDGLILLGLGIFVSIVSVTFAIIKLNKE
jgi:cell division transport system permease protein